jgi:hypothetical protein
MKMRIVGILTLVGSVLFCNLAFASGLSFLNLSFETRAWQICDQDIPCNIIQPKEWAPAESLLISDTVRKLKNGGLAPILIFLKDMGFTFERTTYWYEQSFQFETFLEKTRNDHNLAVTVPKAYVIAFTDSFFSYPVKLDERSNARIQELTVLHEMAHGFDYEGRFSESTEFLQLAGFDETTMKFLNSEELAATQAKIAEQYDKGLYSGAYDLDRNFGMAHGLPRAYSMSQPAEAFADLVSFIYFDSTAPEYINKKLIDYIDKNVLKGVRVR